MLLAIAMVQSLPTAWLSEANTKDVQDSAVSSLVLALHKGVGHSAGKYCAWPLSRTQEGFLLSLWTELARPWMLIIPAQIYKKTTWATNVRRSAVTLSVRRRWDIASRYRTEEPHRR